MRTGLSIGQLGLLVLFFAGCGQRSEHQPSQPSRDSGNAEASGKPEELIVGCWTNGPFFLEFRREGTVRAVDQALRVVRLNNREVRSNHREYDGVYQFVGPSVLRLEFYGEAPLLLLAQNGARDYPITFQGSTGFQRKLSENVSDAWGRVDALPKHPTGDHTATFGQLHDTWQPHKTDQPLPGSNWEISIGYGRELEGRITISYDPIVGGRPANRRSGHDELSLKLERRRLGRMIPAAKGDVDLSQIRFRVEGPSLVIEEGTYKDSVSGNVSLKGEWRRKPQSR